MFPSKVAATLLAVQLITCLLIARLVPVSATSLGLGTSCDAWGDYGCSSFKNEDHLQCTEDNPGEMEWVSRPVQTDMYTLRADSAYYYPGGLVTLHLEVNQVGMKYTGLLLHARNGDTDVDDVGSFENLDPEYLWSPPSCKQAAMHSSATPKPYSMTLFYRAPKVDVGEITFRCLLKFGPANEGEFYYPNAGGPLKMTAAPTAKPPSIQVGKFGQSCDEVCTGEACATTYTLNSAASLDDAVKYEVGCPSPAVNDCSAVGMGYKRGDFDFCFYQDDVCSTFSCSAKDPDVARVCQCGKSEPVDPSKCPDCGSKGKCDLTTGTCKCLDEYTGDLCQLAPENCLDGILNGKEDGGVDCGGPDCPVCTGYKWYADEWGECSVTCGGGLRNREVRCKNDKGNVVPVENCADPSLHTPVYQEECGVSECASYRWEYTAWTDCTRMCGKGTRTREATCFSSFAKTPVLDSLCDVEGKEDTSEDCNAKACDTFHWVTNWGECDKMCGRGQQSAILTCMTFDDKVAESSQCAENEKPLSKRDCNEAACAVVGGEWDVCPWDACTTKCGGASSTMSGSQFRTVLCRDAITKAVTDPALCPVTDRPRDIVSGCNPMICTAPYWMTSSWSGCGITTPGQRLRTVHCHGTNGENAENHVCEATGVPSPVKKEACEVNACPIQEAVIPALSSSTALSPSHFAVLLGFFALSLTAFTGVRVPIIE